MAKSRARFLAELLGSDGLVKATTSSLAGADGIIDLEVLPSIPNSKLTNSSITINSSATSLGGSVTLTTANVAENTNLYYTDARADARIAAADTGDLSEGSNLYYTNARADARVNLQTGSNLDLSSKNTADLAEGTNLYYTNARADARIAAATTDDLSEGSSNLYYTDARADARVALVVDSAPGTLNTLNELAAALGDDANFSTTVTNSIATKLPLAGGTLTGALVINSGTANTGLSITSTDAASWLTMTDPTASLFFGNTAGNYALYTGGTESMKVDTTGKLSIGGATPQGNLTIKGAASDDIDLLTFSEDGTNQSFSFNGNFAGTGSAGNALTLDSYWTNDIMSWRGDGNVGIGTDSPDFTLDVEADKDTWISRIYNTGSDANAQTLLVRSDATAAHDATVMGVYADSGYKMVVKSTGNVGIGEINPAYQLHVAGAGDIKIEDTGGGSAHLHITSSTSNLRNSEWRLKTSGNNDEFTFDHRYTANDGSNDVVGNGTVLTLKSDANVDVTNDVVANNAKLKAIAESNTDTAVDVFVYDTRKDSDGGAWRKRTQHTSWYNETLNTSTRGSRKEFPSVAVIVADSSRRLTIYDGDDPAMPMWMVFIGAAGNMIYVSTGSLNIAMLNGKLAVGCDGANQRLRTLDFIKDAHTEISHTDGQGYFSGGLASRNIGTISSFNYDSSLPGIIDRTVNDVAMTVLPNAPIDADTGLPVPTIAVATNGGVSVIKDDGSVYDFAPTNAPAAHIVDFHEDYIYFSTDIGTYDANTIYKFSIPSSDQTNGFYSQMPSYIAEFNNLRSGTHVGNQGNGLVNGSAYGSSLYGLGLLYEDATAPASSLMAYITSDYNTGWMNGDIKLATLSDTDTTNVTYANLITNGTFDSNITGWSNFTGSVAHDTTAGGRIAVTSNGSYYGGVQTLTAVAGKTYALTFTAVSGTTGARIRAGNASSGTNYLNAAVADGTHTYFFTTDTTTTVRIFLSTSGASGTCYFDNITLSLAERDHTANSVGDSNAKELKVFGTVTKTAVATGAELVGYSFGSNSNYLEQPYNSDLDFGTGDFSVMCWVKPDTSMSEYPSIVDRYVSANNESTAWLLKIAEGTSSYYFYSNNTSIFTATGKVQFGVWQQVMAVRRSGVLYFYLNGRLEETGAMTHSITSSGAKLKVSKDATHHLGNSNLALLRVSATAPSPEQIKKMYNDEKHLFQENAKATLYGSSDAVTALAYDDDTELLHVGTSAGRSVFQGLNRVDNTTDAVGAAISASNGFIVEE